MVSFYSSHPSLPKCQRCETPLFPGEGRCRNCGYEQNIQYGQSSDGSSGSNDSKQQQFKGLLGRYGTSPDQGNDKYRHPRNLQHQQNQGTFVSQVSFDSQPSGSSHPSDIQPISYQGQKKVEQQPSFPSAMFSDSGRVQSAAVDEARYSLSQASLKNKRTPNVGLLVGVALLLIALMSASVLGYLYFFVPPSNSTTPGVKATAHVTTPVGPSLFSDNFVDNAHQWSIQSYPGQFSVSIQNSALLLESDNNKLLWEPVPGTRAYDNFQLSVDATLSKGSQDNGYGIYIRGTVDQNGSLTSYYRFELYGDGTFAIFKSATNANAVPTRLVDYTSTPVIKKQGAVNHIFILAQEKTLRLSVNGTVLSTITDASYTSGTIALFISNLQNAPAGAQAQFSRLAIYAA